MSVLDRIQNAAKFGATVTTGYHRVFVKVAGSNRFWTTLTPSGVLQNVSDALTRNGVGFESIHNNYAWSIDPFYFEFTVTVIAPDSQTNEQVRSIVATAVDSVLSGTVASVISSETANDWALPTVSSLVTGNSNAAIAGISVGTMIVLGVGLIAIFALKNSPSNPVGYVRYFRR